MVATEYRDTLDFLEGLEKIGSGACSDVYRYDDGNVLKVIKEAPLMAMYNIDELSQLVGIKNSVCIFPNKLLYLNGEFKGFYLEYTPGKKLMDIATDIEFETLFECIKKTEEGLMDLANQHIVFNDYNYGAVHFEEDKKRFRIVDTDFFLVCPAVKPEEIYKGNIDQFYLELLMEFGLMNGKLNNFLLMDEEYALIHKKFMASTFTKNQTVPVSEVIRAAIKVFEKKFSKTPRTIAEMNALVDLFNEENGIVEENNNPDDDSEERLASFLKGLC
jgi:hypothetical protein